MTSPLLRTVGLKADGTLNQPAASINLGDPAFALPTAGSPTALVAAADDNRIVGAVQRAATVSDLRAISVPDATVSGSVNLRGYYASGDGGGGEFYWDPAYSYHQVTGVTMASAGTAYHVHDLLTLAGGTTYSAAIVDVLTVDSNGAITSFAVLPGSSYGALPAGAQAVSLYSAVANNPTGNGATFAVSTSKPDDGGMCINPNGYTGPGRWRRRLTDDQSRNVLCWGAQFSNIYGTQIDSLDAINAAIASLPNVDFSPQQYPGAGNSGHQKGGTIFFPPAAKDYAFLHRDTIYISCKMRAIGVKDQSAIGFLNNAVPSAAQEKWALQCLYSGTSNETFFTDVIGLTAYGGSDRGNAGSSGIFYVGCNGGKYLDCNNFTIALRGHYIDSAGCYFNNLRTFEVDRGPGLTITGQQAVGGYVDIEHVNGTGTLIDPGDGLGDPYPAVLFINAVSCHLQQITTEGSGLSVKLLNSPNTIVESLTTNTLDSLRMAMANPATASPVLIYQSDHVAFNAIEEQGGANWTYFVKDSNSGFGTISVPGDQIGPRSSYCQTRNFLRLTTQNFTVLDNATFATGPTINAVDDGTATIRWQGYQNNWNLHRAGGLHGADHIVFDINYYDHIVAPYGFRSSQFIFDEPTAGDYATLATNAIHALTYASSFDSVTRTVATDDGEANYSLGNSLKLADVPLPSAVAAGVIRYSAGHFYGGDGTAWKQLDN